MSGEGGEPPWLVLAGALRCVWRPAEARHPHDLMCRDTGRGVSCESNARALLAALERRGYELTPIPALPLTPEEPGVTQ